MLFKEEADSCRRKANEYIGRPEAPFLLNVARVFDELAVQTDSTAFIRRDGAVYRPKIPV
jgi:hypothetical protein